MTTEQITTHRIENTHIARTHTLSSTSQANQIAATNTLANAWQSCRISYVGVYTVFTSTFDIFENSGARQHQGMHSTRKMYGSTECGINRVLRNDSAHIREHRKKKRTESRTAWAALIHTWVGLSEWSWDALWVDTTAAFSTRIQTAIIATTTDFYMAFGFFPQSRESNSLNSFISGEEFIENSINK